MPADLSPAVASPERGRKIDRWIVLAEVLVGLGVIVAVVGKAYGAASTVAFVLIATATAAAGYFLIQMIASLSDEALDMPGRVLDEQRAKLEHEKFLLLQGIKEFEADAGTGKVDKADYAILRKSAEARALEIIRILKDSDARWRREAERLLSERLGLAATAPGTEVAVAAASGAPATSAPTLTTAADPRIFDLRPTHFIRLAGGTKFSCEGCGQQNDADGRFCIGCGRPRTMEDAQ